MSYRDVRISGAPLIPAGSAGGRRQTGRFQRDRKARHDWVNHLQVFRYPRLHQNPEPAYYPIEQQSCLAIYWEL